MNNSFYRIYKQEDLLLVSLPDRVLRTLNIKKNDYVNLTLNKPLYNVELKKCTTTNEQKSTLSAKVRGGKSPYFFIPNKVIREFQLDSSIEVEYAIERKSRVYMLFYDEELQGEVGDEPCI